MRPARSLRTLSRGPLFIACAVLTLGVTTGCGAGTAAQPTSAPAPTVAAAAPAASPQRPPLAAPSPSPAVGSVGASPGPVSSAEPEQTYEVKSGDTLLTISEEVYGDATKWRKIYDANRDLIGPDPDKLKLEQKLKIPPKDS